MILHAELPPRRPLPGPAPDGRAQQGRATWAGVVLAACAGVGLLVGLSGCSGRAYIYRDFYQIWIRDGFFPQVRADLLAQHIDLARTKEYVHSILRKAQAGDHRYQAGNIACSLFQLGETDIDPALFKKVEQDAFLRRQYGTVFLLPVLKNRIHRRLFQESFTASRQGLVAMIGGSDSFRIKLVYALHEYLEYVANFESVPDNKLIGQAAAILYPGQKVPVAETLSMESLVDMQNAWLLGLPVDRQALAASLDKAWLGGYYRLEQCPGLCDLKSIDRVVVMDMHYHIVSEQCIRAMADYLLARFQPDGSFNIHSFSTHSDDYLFMNPCVGSCTMTYWQVLWDLNYLLGRLDAPSSQTVAPKKS